ncbi:4'-phosphopantetheinyl transferase family protein [Streptomyces californicus]|uniref:4'-phosphopantetheinyl transferase family protein n=1 Tax=Streptomyces californicus TaxID=67351 RepID=UPI0036FBFE64
MNGLLPARPDETGDRLVRHGVIRPWWTDGGLQVWLADLTRAAPATAWCAPDERTGDEPACRRRGVLRYLLAGPTGRQPHEVPLAVTDLGKLHTAGGPEFSLSDSAGLALYAFHPTRPVGVDLQHHDPRLDFEPVVRVLAPPALLNRTDPDHRRTAFFGWWARAEAVTKAHGAGLRLPLRTLACGLPGETRTVPLDGTTWRVRDLPAPACFSAALATAAGNAP